MDLQQQMALLCKGAADVITREDLEAKLIQAAREKRSLRIKLGLDPSAPDLHLGHAVVLRKMRQFQDLGHHAMLIIGDFTGMIGDPTGKSKTRAALSPQQVKENAQTYVDQLFRVLDPDRTQVLFNSHWLEALNLRDVVKLAAHVPVARMMEREDFKKRFQGGQRIGIHEFFYPLMQAYDSIAIRADIELGGNDQRFNILMGRTIQQAYAHPRQAAIFMPLLEGLDGREKMSKSLGNIVGLTDEAPLMFSRVMQVPDSLILRYFELATDLAPQQIRPLAAKLEDPEQNPRDIKLLLAWEITRLYHGRQQADSAREEFIRVFTRRQLPDADSLPACQSPAQADLPRLMVRMGTAPSLSQARRLIAQGGVKVDGQAVQVQTVALAAGKHVVQAGKRGFFAIEVDE